MSDTRLLTALKRVNGRPQPNFRSSRLLDRDALREVARFVHIAAQLDGEMVGELLQRDDGQNGADVIGYGWLWGIIAPSALDRGLPCEILTVTEFRLMRRLIRWFVVHVLFALTPLIASLVVHWCGDKLPEIGWSMVPEIIFFSLMVSVTAFADVLEVSEVIGRDLLLMLTGLALLLGAVWSAAMYGVYVYGHVLSAPTSIFQLRFLFCAKVVAVVLFALSVSVEVMISRVKASDEA